MSESFGPYTLQHTRLSCPLLSPRVCSNSCTLSWRYHPIISPSVAPFSFCYQSFPASGPFPMSQFFTSGGQSIGGPASASVLPMNIQGCFPFWIDWFNLAVQGTLKSLLQHHSSKALVLRHRSGFFMLQLSQLCMTTRKTITLTILNFVSKVMSLLFNTLSRFLIAFLPWNNRLLISWLQSPFAVILEPKKIKSSLLLSFSPSICHEVMRPDAMILVFFFLIFSFKPDFSLLSFTSSRGSLVPLCFLPLEWYRPHTWGYWYFSWWSWFQLVIHPSILNCVL